MKIRSMIGDMMGILLCAFIASVGFIDPSYADIRWHLLAWGISGSGLYVFSYLTNRTKHLSWQQGVCVLGAFLSIVGIFGIGAWIAYYEWRKGGGA